MDFAVSNTAQVKINNIDLIKHAVIKLELSTKMMVAKETGLSVATCNSLLNELCVSGKILEDDVAIKKEGAGRPSKAYRINTQYILGCCLSFHKENKSNHIKYTIIDLLGTPLETDTLFQTAIDYACIKHLLGGLITKYTHITVISVGIPGILDKHQTIISCDLIELNGINLPDRIKKDFGLNAVVENDMNLTAFGLYTEKHYKASHSVVAASFYENVCSGAGITINGEIIKGRSNFAGEVSYLPFQPENNKRIKLPLAKIENAQIIARTICAFITILNPDVILLSGSSISITIMGAIAEHCAKLIPEQHMPELTYAQNTDSYYLSGLTEKALQDINRKDIL